MNVLVLFSTFLFSQFVYGADYLRKELSLVKPYVLENWDFVGSTVLTNNFVRLTPDVQSRVGQIWSRYPVNFRNWEVHVNFKVHGHGTDLFGDGLAIWYSQSRLEKGPIFGHKDFFSGLAIFLDTYDNQNSPHNHVHPYISGMVNNGSVHYDHDRDGTHTELDGCESQFRGVTHDTYLAIRYVNNVLTVSTDIEGENKWKVCFKVEQVKLPTGYYLGATAATGDLSDYHDILSIKFYEIEIPSLDTDFGIDYSQILPSAENHAAPREHIPDDKPNPSSAGSTFLFILKIFGYFIVCSICLGSIAYIVYTSYFSSSRKRFY